MAAEKTSGPLPPARAAALLGSVLFSAALLGCTSGGERPPPVGGVAGAAGSAGAGAVAETSLPFVVDHHFVTTGYMGDGADGRSLVHDTERCLLPRPSGAQGLSHYIGYFPAFSTAAGWAGLYWQNQPDNWGDDPGLDVVAGAGEVAFMAASDPPGVEVTFLAGGIDEPGKPYRDGFSAEQSEVLTGEYASFTIDLSGANYETVLGGFAIVVTRASALEIVGEEGAVSIYVDDIHWRPE